MFDPMNLLKDIENGVAPLVQKARADADQEIAAVKQAASADVTRLVAQAKADADKAVADAKTAADAVVATAKADALKILTDLRSQVGAAAEVARADLQRAVAAAEPGVQTGVTNALRTSFNHILELLAASVL